MAFEFILPDIGEGVVEAEIGKWFVKEGDLVHEDQPLVEVMTDKATVTIPSPRRGRVKKLHYAEGEVARVKAPLLEIELSEGDDRRAAAPPSLESSPPPAEPAPRPRTLATPAVRAMARTLGVELGAVRGSGPGGRVMKGDLSSLHDGQGEEGADPARPAQPLPAEGDEVVPLRGLRRLVAERMARSKRTAAHFTFVEQVDVTELVKVKERIAAAALPGGVKVTFMPFIVKATVAALKRHPWLNATLDEARGEVRLRREYHIGMASATDQGLLVPVLRHADRLSILDLAREVGRLKADSKAGRARPKDLGGSTFTVTSLGREGGLFATPIINHPEVAILGVHRIRPTPVVREGQIVARDVLHISLSLDHRVLDGQAGAAFAYTLIAYLEDPNRIFMELA
ncbi:MAG TPA: dihydrolipoamide acetyltransferase family protein [Anaeromyxobacteraceae bacterium]|nr:dihydrolipoamide acetyltransferase family protein [Anaeromyxobacteraceae bacterium]